MNLVCQMGVHWTSLGYTVLQESAVISAIQGDEALFLTLATSRSSPKAHWCQAVVTHVIINLDRPLIMVVYTAQNTTPDHYRVAD